MINGGLSDKQISTVVSWYNCMYFVFTSVISSTIKLNYSVIVSCLKSNSLSYLIHTSVLNLSLNSEAIKPEEILWHNSSYT